MTEDNTQDAEEQDMQMPEPHPSLKKLDVFVGKWEIKGRTLDTKEDNISGKATFEWLPGEFFLKQEIELDFAGMVNIESMELIGVDPENTGGFTSQVFSNLFGVPAPYKWDLEGSKLTIQTDTAILHGEISKDGNTFSSGWRPKPGFEDRPENIPYDISGSRIK